MGIVWGFRENGDLRVLARLILYFTSQFFLLDFFIIKSDDHCYLFFLLGSLARRMPEESKLFQFNTLQYVTLITRLRNIQMNYEKLFQLILASKRLSNLPDKQKLLNNYMQPLTASTCSI